MSEYAEKSDVREDFLELFKKFENNLNGSGKGKLHQIRKEAIELFEETGFPGAKNEEYKYTRLGKALEKNFKFHYIDVSSSLTKAEFDKIKLPGLDAHELVFVNGRFSKELSSFTSGDGIRIMEFAEAYAHFPVEVTDHFSKYAKIQDDPFVALNTAFAKHGAFIKVDDNKAIEKPVALYYITDAREGIPIAYPRNLVVVGRNAEVSVVESYHTLGDNQSFTDIVSEISVGEDATINYYRLQAGLRRDYHVGTTKFHQAAHSRIHSFTVSLDGEMIRNNLSIALDGDLCEANLYGLYLLHGKSHVDNHTTVDHKKPNSYSNELYKGIMHDNSTGVFNGKIFVRQDAQKTNAFQSNKNILLSDTASVNTKPQLEIWADDVKCSHGCTTGQLDEEQIFYLRSRGMSEESAKAMLLIAFINDILERLKHLPLKESIQRQIINRLHKDFNFD